MKSREVHKFRKTYTKYTYDCISEGYKLAVLFDEKDEVKGYGGRWDAGAEIWWIPASKLLDQIHDNGTRVWDWLNDNQMIMGQYGKVDGTSFEAYCLNPPDADYELRRKYGTTDIRPENTGTFHVWEAIGIAAWRPGGAEMAYMTLDDGRTMWDDLMKSGYRRIIREKTLTTEENTV